MYSYDDRIRAVKLYIKRLSGRFFLHTKPVVSG